MSSSAHAFLARSRYLVPLSLLYKYTPRNSMVCKLSVACVAWIERTHAQTTRVILLLFFGPETLSWLKQSRQQETKVKIGAKNSLVEPGLNCLVAIFTWKSLRRQAGGEFLVWKTWHLRPWSSLQLLPFSLVLHRPLPRHSSVAQHVLLWTQKGAELSHSWTLLLLWVHFRVLGCPSVWYWLNPVSSCSVLISYFTATALSL